VDAFIAANRNYLAPCLRCLTFYTGCNKVAIMATGRRARLKVEQLEQMLRQHGLPLTVQRRAVLEALSLRLDHPFADQIFDDVRKRMPEISRTTVYRVLKTLVRVGVARKVCHPGSAARYEAATHRHHHLVCLNCETMVDLEDASLDSLPLPSASSGFHIEDYSIQFRGLCSDCARKLSVRRAQSASSAAPVRRALPAGLRRDGPRK
jgi:Fur family peroxide stress response transcriptional regulator